MKDDENLIVEEIVKSCDILKILDEFTFSLKSLQDGIELKKSLSKKLAEKGKVIVVRKSLETIGFAGFYCNDLSEKKAFLSLIAVKSDYRKMGIGKLLINNVQKYCISSGMNSLFLEVRKDNQSAMKFYSGIGFELTKTQQKKDSYLMYKKLVIGD